MHEVFPGMNRSPQRRDALNSPVPQQCGGGLAGFANPSHQWCHHPDGYTGFVRAEVDATKRTQRKRKPSKHTDQCLSLAALLKVEPCKPKAARIAHVRAGSKPWFVRHSGVRLIKSVSVRATVTPTTTAIAREVKHDATFYVSRAGALNLSNAIQIIRLVGFGPDSNFQ